MIQIVVGRECHHGGIRNWRAKVHGMQGRAGKSLDRLGDQLETSKDAWPGPRKFIIPV